MGFTVGEIDLGIQPVLLRVVIHNTLSINILRLVCMLRLGRIKNKTRMMQVNIKNVFICMNDEN